MMTIKPKALPYTAFENASNATGGGGGGCGASAAGISAAAISASLRRASSSAILPFRFVSIRRNSLHARNDKNRRTHAVPPSNCVSGKREGPRRRFPPVAMAHSKAPTLASTSVVAARFVCVESIVAPGVSDACAARPTAINWLHAATSDDTTSTASRPKLGAASTCVAMKRCMAPASVTWWGASKPPIPPRETGRVNMQTSGRGF